MSYNILGEKINTYKTGSKIQKLKQNMNKEVVWVMKDNSFVNFIYFLSIDSNFAISSKKAYLTGLMENSPNLFDDNHPIIVLI